MNPSAVPSSLLMRKSRLKMGHLESGTFFMALDYLLKTALKDIDKLVQD